MNHPVLDARRAAVVTGAASGIGLAACLRFAELGMPVCLIDVSDEALGPALDQVTGRTSVHGQPAIAIAADVSNAAEMHAAAATVQDRLGPVGVLMNNAVTRTGGGVWGAPADWQKAMAVNFWGVLNGVNAFVPRMIEGGLPGMVVNCGSKQGITNPPGNAAYNVTKAAVKTYTEALQHELRNTGGCRVSAHLLVPGWTTTGDRPHQPGAWLPDQVVERMEASLRAGDFYIVCPDNEVTRRWTAPASCGAPATSPRTARRCRAGTRTGRAHSRASNPGGSPRPQSGGWIPGRAPLARDDGGVGRCATFALPCRHPGLDRRGRDRSGTYTTTGDRHATPHCGISATPVAELRHPAAVGVDGPQRLWQKVRPAERGCPAPASTERIHDVVRPVPDYRPNGLNRRRLTRDADCGS